MKQELNQSRSGSGFREQRTWSLSTQIGLRGINKESSSALLIALRYLLFLSIISVHYFCPMYKKCPVMPKPSEVVPVCTIRSNHRAAL